MTSTYAQAIHVALLAVLIFVVGSQTLALRAMQGHLATFMQTIDLLERDRPLVEAQNVSVDVGDGPTLGAENASVTIVAFSDFDCAACQQLMPDLHRLAATADSDVRLAYRHFPLRQRGASLEEALAAECAFRQGHFWPMHDVLLANDAATGEATTVLAQEMGLDDAAFATCLAAPSTRARVDADRAAGERFGVDGTPTLFINGHKIAGSVSIDVLEQVIRQIRDLA